ncbi:MAG: methyl-accepting chemotaxis protein [Actinomycetota bacterium]|nr:methyl-accepting chemotaxis protein [Actinomycetota bacterium]
MRLSVRTKLLAGFALVVALAMAVGVVALVKMASINESTKFQSEMVVPGVAVIGDINGITSDYRAAQLDHVIAEPGSRQLESAEAAMKDENSDMDAAIKAYEPTITLPEDRRQFDALVASWERYKSESAPFLKLSRAGNPQAAIKYLHGDAQQTFDRLSDQVLGLVDWNRDFGKKTASEADDSFKAARTFVVIVLVLVLALGTAVSLLLSRQIRNGVQQVLHAAEGIARGELDRDVKVKTRDELGEMADAFGEMTAYLRETASVATRIGQGDLTATIEPYSSKDELRVAMAEMVEGLRALVIELNESAGTVSSASQQLSGSSDETSRAIDEIASAIGDVAQGSETQVRRVGEVRDAVGETMRAVADSARAAEETTVSAEHARDLARGGIEAAVEATEAMQSVRESSQQASTAISELAEKSEQIGEFINTITGIAEQTNLLALNAAIEAARAGEQGRGFAVVAEEVRKLAEESQQAASTISTLVNDIQKGTKHTVGVVDESVKRTEHSSVIVARAEAAFGELGESVEAMTAQIAAISAATTEINASTSRVGDEMTEVAAVAEASSASAEQVSASTQQTSASAQEINASAQELASTAQTLEQLVSRFQVKA